MSLQSAALSEHLVTVLTDKLLETEMNGLVVTAVEPGAALDQSGARLTLHRVVP